MSLHPLFAGILASSGMPQTTYRFEKTSCSQCGNEFGPGDHGFSHCENHIAAAIEKQTDTTINALMRDMADFLFMAGNQLCDDDHETLSRIAGVLLKRVERALEG